MNMHPAFARRRRGFTLIEVVVAAAILFASLAVLSQLAYVGRRHVDKAEHVAIASRLCENELARLLAGIEPIETVESRPLLEDASWECRVELEPTRRLDLWELSVAVRPVSDDPLLLAEADFRPWYRLVHWIAPHRLPAEMQQDLSESDQPSPTGVEPWR